MSKASEPKKILIIDDNPAVRTMLKNLLDDCGYRTILADDGLKGIETARLEKPDLILLDIMLPGMDGYRVCRMIKFDRTLKATPIVILTSRMGEEDEKRAYEMGADAYIVKAVHTGVILDKIRDLLKKTSLRPAQRE